MTMSIFGVRSSSRGTTGAQRGKWFEAAALLFGVAFLSEVAPAYSAEPRDVVVFERAEFVLSDRVTPPDDSAAWREVTLPHDWRTLDKAARATGWYRIRVVFDPVPAQAQGVYLRHLRAFILGLYVNGARYVGSVEIYGQYTQDYGYAFHALVPPALWKPGENVLHFRMNASSHPRFLHGLGRVHVGPFVETAALQRRGYELTGGALRLTFAATLTAGLITLLLWFAHRSDRVMFWFSIACLSWAAANILTLWLQPWMPQWVLWIADIYVRSGLAVPALILALRFVNLRWPRVELGLGLFLLLETTYLLWVPALTPSGDIHWLFRLLFPTASALLLFGGVAIIARFAPRPLHWSHYMEMAALGIMGALMLQDFARYMVWVDFESPIIRPYHVPVMVIAIGVVIFERRHVAALWRVEQANIELERRVDEKAREIRAYHAERQEVAHQHALAGERQRILTDMHDGLGASLVGLLRYVQSRPADAKGIEQRVKEALQEMRIAIDALEPAQGDLASVLGNLRYRLDPLMEAASVHLAWEVAEMPKVEALDPAAVFAIQRAVLEALFNALKHSGAREIRLTAEPNDAGIQIRIDDDGKGFDSDQPQSGRGLGTMRHRAGALGGRVDITSRQGGGTTVIFNIPYTLASARAGAEGGKIDTAAARPVALAAGIT